MFLLNPNNPGGGGGLQPGDNVSELVNDAGYLTAEDLSSTLVFYPTTTASAVGGYYKLVTDIADPDYDEPAVDVSTGAITGTGQLISSLASEPGIVVGELGIFNVTIIGMIRKTGGSGGSGGTFYFEIYKRTSGGTETLIATSDNTTGVSSASYVEFSANALFNDGSFTSTDRIVLKFYGNKTGGGADPTFDFQFGGATPVRALFPVPVNVLLTNYVPYTGATQGLNLGANDFTVDTDVLFVDTTNNRVGIGSASPSAKLHIIETSEQFRFGYSTNAYASFTMNSTGGTVVDIAGASATTPTWTFSDKVTGNADIQVPRQTSAFLIGTNNTISETASGAAYINGQNIRASTSTGNQVQKYASVGDSANFIRMVYNNGFSIHTGVGAGAAIGTLYSDSVNERFRIDTSGNLIYDTNTLYGDFTNNTLGIGTTRSGAISATNPTLLIKSSTSGSGSSAFGIWSAGSAPRLFYRDDGRLWLGTGTPSYNALLSLDTSGTQTEIQFTTNATGRTSTDGAYLMYADSIGFRYLNMEVKPHVFYINSSEVARFSETGAVMQITGTLAAQYSGAGSSRGGAISLVSSAGTAQDWIIATAGNDNSVVNGRSWFLYDNTSSVARFFVNTSGDVGVGLGSNAASARLHLVKTTEQFRSGYDTTNYWNATTGSTGITTFDGAGASAGFVFSKDVSVPDEAYGAGWNGSVEVPTKNALYDKIETLGGGNPGWELVSYSTAAAASSITVSSLDLATDGGMYQVIVKAEGSTFCDYNMQFNAETGGYAWGMTRNSFNGSAWSLNGSASNAGTDTGVFLAGSASDVKSLSAVINLSEVLKFDGTNTQIVADYSSVGTGTSVSNDAYEKNTGSGFTTNIETNITSVKFLASAGTPNWKVWVFKANS